MLSNTKKHLLMKNIYFKLFSISCFIVLMLFSQESKATHIMGADITYTCDSNNTYQIQLKLFSDCISPLSLGNTADVNFSSPTCGNFTISLDLLPNYPLDITNNCASLSSACNGGTGFLGVNEYVYQKSVTLPCVGDYTVSWTSCCRNSALNTLSPSSQASYVQTILPHASAPCNQSPGFANSPIVTFCNNQPVNYSHGVVNLDNDSLAFSLIDCQASATNSVNYASPYSGTNPLSTTTGLTIDSSTGNLQFTPNVIQQGTICVLVEEYRNGVKIGEIMRDLQFDIMNCANSLPVASGINGTASSSGTSGTFIMAACSSDSISFDIQSYDPNVIDILDPLSGWNTISMDWNNGITNAHFSVDTSSTYPVATFSWIPTANDVGFHFFDVIVKDDACPINGINVYTFMVRVVGVGYNLTTPANYTFCLDNVALNIPNFTPIPNGTWAGSGIIDSTLGIFNPAIAGVGNHNILFTYSDTNATCIRFDSINLSVIPAAIIDAGTDDTTCINNTPFNLTGMPLGGTWLGFGVDSVGMFSPVEAGVGIHTMVYSDSFSNCVSIDYKTILVKPLPIISAGVDQTICENTTITLSTQTMVNPPNGIWSGTGIIDATTGLFDLSNSGGGTGLFPVYYSVTENDCSATDTVMVNVISNANIDAGNNFTICTNESTNLTGLPSGGHWSGYGISDTSGIFDLSATGDTGNFVVYYNYSNGSCSGMDSTTIHVQSTPMVNAGVADSLNAYDTLLVLNGYSPAGGYWTGTGIIDSVNGVFDPALAGVGTHSLTYTYFDGVCTISDTKDVFIIFGVGTRDVPSNSKIKVFPNPVKDILNIQFEMAMQESGMITIRNILGEVISQDILPVQQDHQLSIDPQLPKGVYLVSIEIENERYTFRVVKD